MMTPPPFSLVLLPLFIAALLASPAPPTTGNSEEGVVPFVLPDDTFGRLSNAKAVNVTIDTNAHHAAYAALGAGVSHIPTIANNTASERVRPRQVIVLPPNLAATLVTKPNSRMSLGRFWTQVVQPLSTADPVCNKPIVDWWKAATTVNGPDHNMSIDTPQPLDVASSGCFSCFMTLHFESAPS